MRLIHVADLHFGKSLDGLSLLENGDQGYWVDRFLEKMDEVRPDAVLIAGDVYDRGSPSGEAVALLSRLLTALCEKKIPVLMVAGNHDSAQRISYFSSLIRTSGVYVTEAFDGRLQSVTVQDSEGEIVIWMLPFLRPSQVKRFLPEERIVTYQDAA